MGRIILAALAGTVFYFIWQMMAWMAIPLHGPTVKPLKDENAVRDALVAQDLQTGVYLIPYGNDEEMMDPESAFAERHKAGPVAAIFYNRTGFEPMPPSTMAIGFVTDLASAFIVALLLSCTGSCCNSYWRRVGFVSAFGVFLALSAHVSYFNWMHFPADFTIAFIIDVVVGWFLAGLSIAAIVRPSVNVASAG